MVRKLGRLGSLSIALLLAAGCWHTEPNLKPPHHPDELSVPPRDDPHFSSPEYPKEAFNTNNDIKKNFDPSQTLPNGPAGSPRVGSGPGGGYGR